ncbi:hypothetical protein ACIRQP_04540 [Streptomyces sp. NPDC102274]|uniref:hypothetical protein n=1 Tax=Streptomyces sp. NPDC102274 TaxID=3366151 RepID=UPI0038135B98
MASKRGPSRSRMDRNGGRQEQPVRPRQPQGVRPAATRRTAGQPGAWGDHAVLHRLPPLGDGSQGHHDLAAAEVAAVLSARRRVLGPEHPYPLSTQEWLDTINAARDEP